MMRLTYRILLNGHSASWKLNAENKSRSFQNADWTYRQLLKQLKGVTIEIGYCHDERKLGGVEGRPEGVCEEADA